MSDEHIEVMEDSIPKSELKKFGICWFEYLNVITGSIPRSPTVSKDHPTTGQGVRGEEEEGLKLIENMDKSRWKIWIDAYWTDGGESVDELGDAEHQLGLESVGVEAVALLVHAHLHHHR